MSKQPGPTRFFRFVYQQPQGEPTLGAPRDLVESRYMTFELPDDLVVPGHGQQRSRWETFAPVLTALATLALSLTGAKWYSQASLGVATLLIAAYLWYSPLRSFVQQRRLRARRTRVARNTWPEFQQLERRFSEFLSERNSKNLRYIINDIGGCNETELLKLCPPDYLNIFYPILARRHSQISDVGEEDFRVAPTELISMVSSYNTEYVLQSLERLKTSPRFTGLDPNLRKYREEAIEAFREQWVRFLDDLTIFVDARNAELEYDPYQPPIAAYFERPKKLA